MASDASIRYVPLGPLDHIAPRNIPQSIIYLGFKQGVTSTDAFACLREGLRRTILQAPWLNGRVYLRSQDSPGWGPGQLEIRYEATDQGHEPSLSCEIPLRHVEIPDSSSFSELREAGFPLDVYGDRVLLGTSPFHPDFVAGVPVFLAQANFVPGGCILALSIAPPASDGTAMLSITKLWADYCSSLMFDPDNKATTTNLVIHPPPTGNVDRNDLDVAMMDAITSLDNSFQANQDSDFQHVAGIHDSGEASDDNGQERDMKPSMFYMPQPKYANLRQELVSEHNGIDVSGNDVICAFIWKHILKARAAVASQKETDMDEVAHLAIPFDARPMLSHLVPANYYGNLNFEHIVSLPLQTLISKETSVPWLAKFICTHATSYLRENALLQAYSQLRSVDDKDDKAPMRMLASRLSAKSACVGILSPIVLPFDGTRFGERVFTNGGRPEAFRPMMGTSNRGYRTCFVIPRKPHGGIEFVMTLSAGERSFLQDDSEFSRYAFSLD